MGSPKEISNIEHFPLSPRMEGAPVPSSQSSEDKMFPETARRSLTPAHNILVEFWHQGEKAVEPVIPVRPRTSGRPQNPAKRADQLGLIMGTLAIIVVAVTALALYLNNKKYSYKDGSSRKSATPIVEFYQGNNAFMKKVKEEKGAVKRNHEDGGVAIPDAGEGMDISLKEQMASMEAKLEKIRAEKLIEEPPISMPDKLARPPMPLGLKPADLKKFDNPLEFNGMLPKPLQQAK